MPTLKVKIGDRWYTTEVSDPAADPAYVVVDGDLVKVTLRQSPTTSEIIENQVDGKSSDQKKEVASSDAVTQTSSARKVFYTPMPGMIISILVQQGDQVVTGDEICVLEAMKMQQVLRADWTGVVRAIHVQVGQQVLDGDPLVELE